MQTKNKPGSANWTDPDDAPPLTAEMLKNAEVFESDNFVRRGRGRPPTGHAKEQVSLRLDPDLLAQLRASGPGWQSRVNDLLHFALAIQNANKEQGPVAEPSTAQGLVSKARTA